MKKAVSEFSSSLANKPMTNRDEKERLKKNRLILFRYYDELSKKEDIEAGERLDYREMARIHKEKAEILDLEVRSTPLKEKVKSD